MADKKNIDRIFQERFKDFEVTPPPGLWENIEQNIPSQKPEKKGTPIWIYWSGIAAAIAIIVTTVYFSNQFTDNVGVHNEIVTTPDLDPDVDETEDRAISYEDNSSSVSSTQDNTEATDSNTSSQSNNTSIRIDNDNNQSIISDQQSKNNSVLKKSDRAGVLVNNSSKSRIKKNSKVAQKRDLLSTDVANQNFAQNNLNNNDKIKNGIGDKTNNPLGQSMANNSQETPSNQSEVENNGIKATKSNLENDQSLMAHNKKFTDSLNKQRSQELDAMLAAQKLMEEKNDSTSTVFSPSWQGSSLIAPVYSDVLSGTAINDQVTENETNGSVNLSVGFNVAYNFAPRWSVRTGVHRMRLNYGTQDVVYNTGFDFLARGSTSSTGYDPNAVSTSNQAPNNVDLLASSFNQEFGATTTFNGIEGELRQDLGYVEVPLEVQYTLIDSQFKFNVLAGFSALFLTDNVVVIENEKGITTLGEDSNFNTFNQSANFGLGLDYNFNNKIGVSLEPMLKYQLNTLRTNSENFRPFAVGIYSGVRYRF
ncbi:outer membrane beta-barrel protein [Nonlabens tegetincola]|uniref:outer membrane beta-barrel protein n=1 Tax=Nonlabens tegetincola TaxID=323273 RepID=UPI0030C89DB1